MINFTVFFINLPLKFFLQIFNQWNFVTFKDLVESHYKDNIVQYEFLSQEEITTIFK